MTDQPWEPPQGADASYALFAKEARVRVDDGTSIAYTFRNPTGRSIPLLFANGWSCSDAYWGKLVTDLEARGHPCLVPDTRGHGASGLPRSPGRGAKNLSLSEVIVEVARDLKQSQDQRKEDQERQAKNQKRNDRLRGDAAALRQIAPEQVRQADIQKLIL